MDDMSPWMILGFLATGVVLFGVDLLLDRQFAPDRRRLRGPMPYWWLLVAGMPAGWVGAMVESGSDSSLPLAAQAAVALVMTAVAVAGFCLRFGIGRRRLRPHEMVAHRLV